MGNVVKYLKEAAERNPGRTALSVPWKECVNAVSYLELWSRIDAFSAALDSRGLKPGDRVVIMVPMSVELYVSMLGVMKMGGVAVFADPWVKKSQIVKFCRFASPRGFVGLSKSHFIRFFDPVLRKIPISVSIGSRLSGILARSSYPQMLAEGGTSSIHPKESGDPALITFTTGSSGTPKGANRTHGFLSAQKVALDREFPVEDTDIDMPMFPVFALRNLADGISSVIPDMDFRLVAGVDGDVIYSQLLEHKVNTLTASPRFLDNLASRNPGNAALKVGLRRILTGGAPVRDSQLKTWREAFPDAEIQIVYGSTEAEPVAHISLEDRLSLSSMPGFCAGKPSDLLKRCVIRISSGNESGGEKRLEDIMLKDGEIGELAVSGKHVCRDYFKNPDAVKENKIVDENGELWHRMGDTGYFDKMGRFFLVGRVHSTIFRAGKAQHPQIIEELARGSDPRIRNIAALGIPDDGLREKVVLVVETSEDKEKISRDIRGRIEGGGVNVDQIVVSQKAFPLDPRHNSKIDYSKLRKMIS